MQVKTLILSTFAAVGLTAAANAADRTFDGGGDGTSWGDAENWSDDTMPVDGDKAIIPDGFECHVEITNARADAFEVQAGGLLVIDSGKLLEIDSNSSVADVNGVQLAGVDSTGSTLKISGTLTLSGAGSIQGAHDASDIEIGSSFTLTNTADVVGILDITGDGTFVNGDGGVVNANASGTLDVNPGALGADHANAQWRVSASGATLKFSKGNISMAGSFYLDSGGGTMRFDAAVTTQGGLTQEAGDLDINQNLKLTATGIGPYYQRDGGTGSVAAAKRFDYDDFSGSQQNPDNTADSDPPYEVVAPLANEVTW